jgi:hypothetical protein
LGAHGVRVGAGGNGADDGTLRHGSLGYQRKEQDGRSENYSGFHDIYLQGSQISPWDMSAFKMLFSIRYFCNKTSILQQFFRYVMIR